MLADKEIKELIKKGKIFDQATVVNNKFDVHSSTIDLSICEIYVPETKELDVSVEDHILRAGETVIIVLNEVFRLDKEVGGILFPRNSLSKRGIIMTNPGHIDPGYKGKLTIYLVNMSKKPVSLIVNEKIARLILFKTSSPTTGYSARAGLGVSKDQLSRMGKDFAGLDQRIPGLIIKILRGWSAMLIAVAAVIISIISIAIPISYEITSSRLNDNKELIEKNNQQELALKSLKEEVEKLKKSNVQVINKSDSLGSKHTDSETKND
ncbi:dCTP deaminase [Pantoea vagans]|uniref:dCTP deaminase n=1 Tax=Pantoea vagans TaxID=470934 RepID=UPI00076B4CA3|nr:hypothetical protein [Pantoea vagans]